jgi:hypothetical protein
VGLVLKLLGDLLEVTLGGLSVGQGHLGGSLGRRLDLDRLDGSPAAVEEPVEPETQRPSR